MPVSKANRWTNPPSSVKYAVTLVSVASAVIVAWVLWHYWHSEAFASVFFCAIIFGAWFGGFRQGLLAVAVSAVAFDYFFLSPTHSFYLDSSQLPRLIIFIVSALIMGFLTASQRSTTVSLRRARDDLSVNVQELERTNKELRTENSERRLTQIALRRSQAYLAEAQGLSHTGSFGWTVTTGEIIWSEESFRIFQYDRTTKPAVELILQRVHPEDAPLVKQTIERASQHGKDFDHEYRLVMPDGSVKCVQVVAHALRDDSGSIEFVGTLMDITERKRAEKALRQSEAYLQEAQKLGHIGSWAFNETKALYWSEENFRIWGFDPQQGLPDRVTVLQRIHSEDRSRVIECVQNAVREKRDYALEFRIVLPDGAVRYIHGAGHPAFSASGELVEVVGTNVDVTERRRAEEVLRQAQADLAHVNRVTTMGELTASLAHEVNQPIAAAVTNANTCVRWLAREHPDLEEARAAAMRIVKDGTRAAEIVSRIRQIFKKSVLERELVDVNIVIREMIVLLHGEAMKHHISFLTELAADLPKVLGDRVQLQQVVMNLIVNSIDAMKDVDEKREVVIKSHPTENAHIMVSVSDTGMGLPPQQEDQVFNAFFTTKPNGTGMGLRICRSIVESHGGRLWAATGKSGRGATFQFTLPTTVEAHEPRTYADPNSLRV
jgi:PAS domain S-box-containing protein